MKTEALHVIKHGLVGASCGVVLTLMLGINTGLLVTRGESQKMARAAAIAAEAEICVARFVEAPGHADRLKAFKTMSFTQRDEFIEKGGWNRMPGSLNSEWEVGRRCVERLATLAGSR